MIPQEAANDALEITLADVQSLIKRCMKLKEADPETLRLSDEIARRVVSYISSPTSDFFATRPFHTGQRLETLCGECDIILSPATLLRRRYPAVFKGWCL
jgi:hypothetical protein